MKSTNPKLIIIAWIFFVCLIIGRAIAIIATHDDVTSLGEFWDRLFVWDFSYFLILIPLIIGTVLAVKRKEK